MQVDSGIRKFWSLPDLEKDTWHYPSKMDLLEGENFELLVAKLWDPKKADQHGRQLISIVRSVGGVTLDDLFPFIHTTPRGESNFALLELKKLKRGQYKIFV